MRNKEIRIARTAGCSLSLLVTLLVPPAEAAPLDSLLIKAAVYADSNGLATARGILDAVAGGQAPTPGTIESLATFFRDYRLHEEGAAAMRGRQGQENS